MRTHWPPVERVSSLNPTVKGIGQVTSGKIVRCCKVVLYSTTILCFVAHINAGGPKGLMRFETFETFERFGNWPNTGTETRQTHKYLESLNSLKSLESLNSLKSLESLKSLNAPKSCWWVSGEI